MFNREVKRGEATMPPHTILKATTMRQATRNLALETRKGTSAGKKIKARLFNTWPSKHTREGLASQGRTTGSLAS